MKNIDRIKAMNSEELASLIVCNYYGADCQSCFYTEVCDGEECNCAKGIERWLESEAEQQ